MRYSIGCVALGMLVACGEAGAPNSPKERRNEERPIERVLRQLRTPTAPGPARVVEGPVAAAELEALDTLGEVDEPADATGAEVEVRAVRSEIAGSEVVRVETVREETARDETAPDETAPDETARDETAREETVREETARPEMRADREPVREDVDAAAIDRAAAPITLTRMIIASGIDGREPSGTAPFAAAPERIYLFIEADNSGPSDRIVQVVFHGPGAPSRPVELAIPTSRRWRTWATTRRVEPGPWTVRVLDESNHEIGRATYEIPSAPAESLAT